MTPGVRGENLRGTATSLQAECGHPVDREALAVHLLRALEHRLAALGDDSSFASALEEIRHRSLLLGREVSAYVNGREIRGTATNIGTGGELLLRLPDGQIHPLISADLIRTL